MYDPYTMDRFRFEQTRRQRKAADPRPTRARAVVSREQARAELRWRGVSPATD